MNALSVQMIKCNFTAYEFTGTEQDAKEFSERWGGSYSRDPLHPYQYCVRFKNGDFLENGSYLVVDEDRHKVYSKEQFYLTFTIIRHSLDRYGMDNLMAS